MFCFGFFLSNKSHSSAPGDVPAHNPCNSNLTYHPMLLKDFVTAVRFLHAGDQSHSLCMFRCKPGCDEETPSSYISQQSKGLLGLKPQAQTRASSACWGFNPAQPVMGTWEHWGTGEEDRREAAPGAGGSELGLSPLPSRAAPEDGWAGGLL